MMCIALLLSMEPSERTDACRGTYRPVSRVPGACRQLDLFFAVLESAQFFHHALGFADFVREHEKTGDKITNPIRNVHNCCNKPALLVEQLAAFTIAVAVLKPLLKVASCGVFQDMALAQRKVVKRLREVVQDEVKVLQLIRDSVLTPCSNALWPFGPMERFAGGVAERSQPNLAQAAADCGVRGSIARTPSHAALGDSGDADGSDNEEHSDSDCEAGGEADVREAATDIPSSDEGIDAYVQPKLLHGDTVRAASQPPQDYIEDATVAEREQAAEEALEREPLFSARYDCPIAPSRHGVLRNECTFDLKGVPPAGARVLEQAIEALYDAAGPVSGAQHVCLAAWTIRRSVVDQQTMRMRLRTRSMSARSRLHQQQQGPHRAVPGMAPG